MISIRLTIPRNSTDIKSRVALDQLGTTFLEVFSASGAGEFTGEEHFPDFAVYFISINQSAKAIRILQESCSQVGFLQSAKIALEEQAEREESLSDTTGVLKLLTHRPSPRRGRKPKVGDYYALPLPDGRLGYGRFVHKDPDRGDLFETLSVFTTPPAVATLDDLMTSAPLFPPVITSVAVGIEVGWKYIGQHRGRVPFEYPVFRSAVSSLFRNEAGEYDDWCLCYPDGHSEFVGRLSPDERRLEFQVGWPPHDLMKRIATGINKYDGLV